VTTPTDRSTSPFVWRWLRRLAWSALAGGLALAVIAGAIVLEPLEPPAFVAGPHRVSVVETRQIVPGEGLPNETNPGASNNNLDALRHHDGFVYLAFRTAPHHFASPDTRIEVVRSRDEILWEHETSYALGTDLREPRLLSHGGGLFLYVSELGSDPFDFEPRGIRVAERDASGAWSTLDPLPGGEGFIGWRARKLGGESLLIAYSGGGSIYSAGPAALQIELWKTQDGRHFAPFSPKHPVLDAGGGSEADFNLLADGSLIALVRNEGGDSLGWGSKICTAPAGDPANWHCRGDRRKFDSPFAFRHDGTAYFIARRNLFRDGDYDLEIGPGRFLRSLINQIVYSATPKRCALWRFDPATRRIRWVIDLPSRGDTCFAAALPGSDSNEVVVYDYSSPLSGPDLRWIRGQRGETRIYRHVLRFTRS
jgi:hypothetical protein